MEQFNLDMLKDKQMRQQYAVEVNNIFDCLEHEVTEQEYEKDRVDILWKNIKEGIQKAAHSILPKIVKKNKKAWISTDILDMMEKRKRAKNTQDYDEINRQVKRACKIAKENWLEEQCQEIENLEKQHLTRQMHEKIRRVTNRRKITQTTGVMDKQDNMCFEKEALVNVWTEYIGELYADDRVTRPEINDESGPSITSAEVKHAIKKLKNNKATGTDLIAAEMLKALATRCQEYRTISIMSQVTKLLLNIVMDRMEMKVEEELDDAQSGFRQGKGTREGLLNLRLICERHLEVQKDVYICFLDYEKAFDRVRHEPLIQCLREIGVDGKDIKIIRNLYWDQTASVRIMSELSDDIRIQRGVRQGCVASPTLFNLYTEKIFRHIINMKGVNVGGKNYNNLRYVDDTALLAGNEKELTELTSKINEVGKQFGMKINIKKTKVMVVSRKPNSPKINIAIDGQQIEQVTSYMYLGSLITEDVRCEKEIKRRIMIARTTFTNMRTLLSCRGINLKTRLPCYLVPSSRGRLLVIPMTVSLQASRSLVSAHSSVSVQFVMALMASSHRARGLPLFLAPPPIPNIIDFSKLFSLRMMCPKYDSCCFFISASSGLVGLISSITD